LFRLLMKVVKTGFLALFVGLALYSLVGLANELTKMGHLLPIVAPTELYVGYPWNPARNLVLENHAINVALFGVWPLWSILRKRASRLQEK
jgi:hypothetical protein